MSRIKTTLIGSFIIAAVGMIFLVSGKAQTDTVKFTDESPYYKDAKCVVCPGQKGENKFAAELKDKELVPIILNGKKSEKPPNMPAYEPKGLTADQAKALLDYMRELKKQ